ncbi:anti-sigma factor [Nocardiopsis sp. YSL2]|uniref:anti-sigma factor family protein n=1 Tax=Nocardiopsis sp. YSL2 TaxID=2939492 RepID=UPI0026F40A8C|nr:zf-HC2 domain-containing protein [Nocardiopsis sp. YSL2]
MTSHPDVEALAFYAEDLLDPDEKRTVAAHIDSCATCAATLDELAGVTRVLSEVPVPELPGDVADLIDQRLAKAARGPAAASAQAGTRAAGTKADVRAASGDGSSDDGVSDLAPVTPIPRRRRTFGLPHLLIAAAAAVFVVGGGAAVITDALQPSVESAGAGSASDAPLKAPEEEALQDMGQSYRPVVLASETVYSESGLADQAGEVLDLSAEADGDEDGDLAAQSEEGPALQGVQECAARLGEALGTRVTLVDDAFYGTGSERAWVLYAPTDDDRVDVYVLDPRCVQEDEITRSVLAETTVDAR